MIRIYFAGPLFTTYERKFIDECTAKLRAEGFEVFVPHEGFQKMDAAERQTMENLDDRGKALNCFFKDYEALSWANVLVAMIDGTQVDDGTATEIGIFCEQMLSGKDKKGVFALTSDMRVGPKAISGEMKQPNFFTIGAVYRAGGEIYDNIDDIILKLKDIDRRQQTQPA
ncbi:MAG: nucleoside 2-deoxyribosyltransferase [Bacillota bacterium]